MFKFDNVGQKIKKAARIIAIVVFVMFLLSAVTMFFNGISMLDYSRTAGAGVFMIFFSILMVVIGYGVAWMSSVSLYGFGELIDKTTDTNERIANIEKNVNQIASKDAASDSNPQ